MNTLYLIRMFHVWLKTVNFEETVCGHHAWARIDHTDRISASSKGTLRMQHLFNWPICKTLSESLAEIRLIHVPIWIKINPSNPLISNIIQLRLSWIYQVDSVWTCRLTDLRSLSVTWWIKSFQNPAGKASLDRIFCGIKSKIPPVPSSSARSQDCTKPTRKSASNGSDRFRAFGWKKARLEGDLKCRVFRGVWRELKTWQERLLLGDFLVSCWKW